MATTFGLTLLAWVFFRAASLPDAFFILGRIFSASLLRLPEILPKKDLLYVALFFAVEWAGRAYPYPLAGLSFQLPRVVRWSLYYMLALTVLFSVGNDQQFIYFQF